MLGGISVSVTVLSGSELSILQDSTLEFVVPAMMFVGFVKLGVNSTKFLRFFPAKEDDDVDDCSSFPFRDIITCGREERERIRVCEKGEGKSGERKRKNKIEQFR